jgi:hypothetical protein
MVCWIATSLMLVVLAPRIELLGEQRADILDFAIAAGADIEHCQQMGVAEACGEGGRLRHCGHPIGLAGIQRLQAIGHAGLARPFTGLGQGVLGAGGIARGFDAALAGAAMDQIFSAEIGGEEDEAAHERQGLTAQRRIGRGDGKARGCHQQPMQPQDGRAGIAGQAAQPGAFRGRQKMRCHGIQGEGGYLQPGIAEACREIRLGGKIQVAHDLIAKHKFHGSRLAQRGRDGERAEQPGMNRVWKTGRWGVPGLIAAKVLAPHDMGFSRKHRLGNVSWFS